MNRREFLKQTCLLGASALLAGTTVSSSVYGGTTTNKPNIIFFFVDDMGWQDTSEPFHTEVTALNQRYHTPNMERLADSGMKFTQAYACAVCSPSRISLMTGLNSARHKVTNWTLRPNISPDRPHPTLNLPLWNVNGISPVPDVNRTAYVKTLPMFLQKNGYRTIHAGKAHFGADGLAGEMPENLGFDVNIAGHCAGGPGSYYGTNNFSAAFRNGDLIWDIPGLEKYHGQDIYLNEALTIEALEAVNQAVATDKPFYLYMSHYAIHAPWEKDNRYYQKYIDAGLDDFDATYASMIESMDKSLGDICSHIKAKGIDDNTIILFMTDNGQPSQADRNLPLRGHKLTPYEGGIRVPAMVKWPGVVEPGSVCNDYIIIEDIFPTIIEMAGLKDCPQIGGKIDGISFVPLLRQKPIYPANRAIFWHFPHNYGQEPYTAIRKGDWKLIYFHANQRYELYNLAEDISEANDLFEQRKDIVQRLAEELRLFMIDAEAQMPTYKSSGKPVPLPGIIDS
ncbi:MAG: sulfatase [Phycisphaerae bacterium]|nr:sulfatase [Phycisphaerae bacterium]